jgi:predicted phage terminase large subunit-like protein
VNISERAAAMELMKRRRMRESLVGFVEGIDVPGAPMEEDPETELFHPVGTGMAAHHLLLCRELQKTMETPYGRLMVFMPPGSAKSTYGTVIAPTWYMGKNPGSKIILASYGADLAKKQGAKARSIVRQPSYRAAFGCSLSKDTNAKEEWAINFDRRGLPPSEYMAGGILTGITGNRSHGMIIDDPIKGREAADSPAIRKKTIEAWEDDLMTRFVPGCWVILIQTRWHAEDLAGMLLPKDYAGQSGVVTCRDNMPWNVINLPAEANRDDDPLGRAKGEMLWPEWFTEQHWAQYRSKPRTWAALYQQTPTVETGKQFDADWVKWHDPLTYKGVVPNWLNVYSASDYAVSDEDNDHTEHGVFGVDQNGHIWGLDWWRGQKETDVTIDALLNLARKWKVRKGLGEKGTIEKAIAPAFRRRVRELRIEWNDPYFSLPITYLPSIASKVARFQSFRSIAHSGKFHLPDTPWARALVDQLVAFPQSSEDDGVDVCSLIGRALDELHWGREPPEPERRPELVPFTAQWLEYDDPRRSAPELLVM